MRLGGPIFLDGEDPEELAREHSRLGYGAAYCPPVFLDEPERIRSIRETYAREGLVIAEVGAWKNLMAPDPAERRGNFSYVRDRLALAEEIGALCCVTLSGSFSPTSGRGPHPDDMAQAGFDLTVENVRKLLDSVRPKRTRFVLEMSTFVLPNGPDPYLALLRAVDRPAFAVHFDPVNSINCPERYFHTGDFIRECFAKLGPWIVSCHAKDTLLKPDRTMHVEETRIGLGNLDYRAFLTELARLPGDIPLMLEHLHTAEEYRRAAAHLRGVAEEVGVAFDLP